MERIVIAGGTGFLGKALEAFFEKRGYEVMILTRNPRNPNHHKWDGRTIGPWWELLEDAQAIINLAGKSVNCRYNERNKQRILASRIDSTSVIGQAIQACEKPPKYWVQSSTATIYDDTRGDLPANTEDVIPTGNDFSVYVAKTWEETFQSIETPDTKRLLLRTAIVYGQSGGAFPVIKQLAEKGLCSPQGSGDQWISWIHEEDFCRSVDYLMNLGATGVFNLAAPNPIQNSTFSDLLRKHIQVPIAIPQPTWMLEIGAALMRTETELILKSRKVVPKRLLDRGYRFHYPTLPQAMNTLI
ncbi:TIGR01777 family oxidoreductase [Pontibacter sp. G13]|uniref:TIGR01777 family oxidoreductase n=1 Tax=Pontibacter sp. G13 TaxID=3074898 RepID=UPI00288C0EF0|nr:TIGR01777 family oxidoreductase [Pontibacter sp. G13]WNJ17351.1 TIGR01777 family oxidoreductase [Pontibacter sp. G13]